LNKIIRASLVTGIKVLVILKRVIRVEVSRGIINLLEVYYNLIGAVL